MIKNKLNKDCYFDADRFPFGYNDIDWYNRFIKIGGNAIIIPQCVIDHKYERTWIAYDKNLKNYRISNNGNNGNNGNNDNNSNGPKEHYVNNNEIEKLFLVNKINELNFDWINYLIKNRDLQNKGIKTQKDALNHYLTIGKYQKRPF